jgi:hypothetical protein
VKESGQGMAFKNAGELFGTLGWKWDDAPSKFIQEPCESFQAELQTHVEVQGRPLNGDD